MSLGDLLAAIEAMTSQSIEWEGPSVAEQGLEAPPRRREREGRDGGRSARRVSSGRSGGRDRDSSRGLDSDAGSRRERSAPRTVEAEDRSERSERAARPPRDGGRRSGSVRDDSRPSRWSDRHGGDDAPVIGLGDHVPAFLLRPVQAKASE